MFKILKHRKQIYHNFLTDLLTSLNIYISVSQQVGRDLILGRRYLLLGRQNLCYFTRIVLYGSSILYYCALWVANYQTLRSTDLHSISFFFFLTPLCLTLTYHTFSFYSKLTTSLTLDVSSSLFLFLL